MNVVEPRDLFCIVPAAGLGRRLESSTRKAATRIGGKPLASWSVSVVASAPRMMGGVLVVHGHDLEVARDEWLPAAGSPEGWTVVEGGDTRCASVAQGLLEVPPDAEYVMIHDAARPLLSSADRDRVIAEARSSGAAVLVHDLSDTVYRVTPEAPDHTREAVARDQLVAAQTPQVFRRDWIVAGHAAGGDTTATDDGSLVIALGHALTLVRGTTPNLKVTHALDLHLASAYLTRTSGP